jgi:MEMO1 family protein
MSLIRKAAVAGYFYPSDAKELKQLVSELLEENQPEQIPEKLFGLVVPHAGYKYSGKTAAFAFNTIQKAYKTIIIIAPSHRKYFPGISVFNGDYYETPLGKITIDRDAADKLVKNSYTIFYGDEGHGSEHAIEVMLPFLQVKFGDFKFVPVVMGDQGEKYVSELAEKLGSIADDDILIIASSDLSHYYSKAEAEKRDIIIEARIKEFNYESLMKELEQGECEACGGGLIVALMKSAALAGKEKSLVLYRTDSSEASGDEREVVGYISAAVYGE